MSRIEFTKMHGLGNDFVVLDARRTKLTVDPARARALADRRRGIGCDQVILLEPARNGDAQLHMRIFNADGSEVAACGNASRCIGAMLLDETGTETAVIETDAGLLEAVRGKNGIAIDMGLALDDWRDIPLIEARDTLHLEIVEGPLADPVAVSVGNPHAVFFVEDAEAVPLAELGPKLEHHPLFPERTNVEVVEVQTPTRLRVRVWERGAGITQACGTGACAAAVAANRREMAERRVTIVLDGGELDIHWREDGHVIMTGPVATVYSGVVDEAALS